MSTLKIVIAGSRSIEDEKAYAVLKELVSTSLAKHALGAPTIVIISGGAEGVDQLAKRYAKENAFLYREMTPQYRHRGDTRAPLRRNRDMAKEGHILVALWDGHSPGTRNMMSEMKRVKKPVYFEVFTDVQPSKNRRL